MNTPKLINSRLVLQYSLNTTCVIDKTSETMFFLNRFPQKYVYMYMYKKILIKYTCLKNYIDFHYFLHSEQNHIKHFVKQS